MKLKAASATYAYSGSKTKAKEEATSWKTLIFVGAALAILTLAFYWPSLKYDFVFDDTSVIKKFFNIRHWGLKQLFFHHARWISFWISTICYNIDGYNPFWFRLVNLVFHISSGIALLTLFYLLLSNLKQPAHSERSTRVEEFFQQNAKEIALLTAALFLLHPVQTQTVTYVVQGQLEGLATLFVSLILLCYFLAQQANGLKKSLLTAATFLLAIISTGTKEIAIVSPALVALIDWFFIAQGDFKNFAKRLPLIIGLGITTFAFYIYLLKPSFLFKALGLQLTAHNNIGNILTHTGQTITPMHFLISQFKVTLHYMFIYLWPFNIAADYDWKLVESFASFDCLAPLAILLTMLGTTFYLLKKNRTNLIAFGLVWFFICNAPRSTIIASSELVADYKAYLPAIGWLFIISAAIIFALRKLLTQKNLIYAALGIATLCAFGTYCRNLAWSSPVNFWQDVVAKGPNKPRSLNNLGVELNKLSRCKEAIPLFKKAISLEPNYWDPYENLAAAYAIYGDIDKAVEVGEKSVQLNPHNHETLSNLGSFYMFKGNLDRAEKLLQKSLALKSTHGKAHYNMGKLYLEKNDLPKAWLHYKKACREADMDGDLNAILPYAGLSIELAKWDDAIWAIKKVLRLAPNSREAMEHHFNLGNCYAQKEEFDLAINTYKKHMQRYPQDYRAWCNLAELYLVTKQLDKAGMVLQEAAASHRYPGIEIQQAKYLIAKGSTQEAKKVLEKFLEQPNLNAVMAKLAKQMLETL